MKEIPFRTLLGPDALPSPSGSRLTLQSVEWHPFVAGEASGRVRRRLAVRLRTESGAEGHAVMPMRDDPQGSQAFADVTELIQGRDGLEIARIWDELHRRETPLWVLSAVDVALWDLYGRHLGKPVHAALGTRRDRIKVYVSTPFNLGPPEKYAEFAERCRDGRFHGNKIHPVHNAFWDERRGGDVEQDVRICRAVREAVGPDYAVMLDPFLVYSYEDALRMGRVMDELRYRWYESPMPENEAWIDRYVELRKHVQTPLVAPECQPGSYDTRLPWIERGACDICRIDVFFGGFTAILRLAAACDDAGIPLELHTPGDYYHLQIMGATGDTFLEYFEAFSTSREPRTRPGVTTPAPVADAEGFMPVPMTPGMGIDPDWDYITRHPA
jgi:L-alanine-DL-glutamate epimerase-like enolase superfamily enzyme